MINPSKTGHLQTSLASASVTSLLYEDLLGHRAGNGKASGTSCQHPHEGTQGEIRQNETYNIHTYL